MFERLNGYFEVLSVKKDDYRWDECKIIMLNKDNAQPVVEYFKHYYRVKVGDILKLTCDDIAKIFKAKTL